MPINGFQMHVTFPYFTGLPEDVVTNVWSFQYVTLAPSAADWLALRARLITFYGAVYGGTGFTSAPWLRPVNTNFKGYDLNDPIPRAPRYNTTTTVATTITTPCTAVPETAICLSFQGVLVSGQPQSRRRGRIYLGGLGVPVAGGSASTFPLIPTGQTTVVLNAATAFKAGCTADGWTWSVYSRTNDAMVTVDNGWIDNAADTQRRRGQQQTLRSVFP